MIVEPQVLTLQTFESMNVAYTSILRTLRDHGTLTEAITDPTSVGSSFGSHPRRTTELVATGFSITNPRARWLGSENRGLNKAFAVANTLWTVSGSNRLVDIEQYNRRGEKFAKDGLLEGAVGHRIVNSAIGDQLDRVLETLRRAPSSRRAVVQIFSPQDLAQPPLDTPCTISLQYLVRAGRVDSITSMRSQSAAFLLPYDVYLFSMLQEMIASELGLELGTYHHFCGSLHYYEDEVEIVTRILNEPVATNAQSLTMPEMPAGGLTLARRTASIELELRRQMLNGSPDAVDLKSYGLPLYWHELLSIVAAKLSTVSRNSADRQ